MTRYPTFFLLFLLSLHLTLSLQACQKGYYFSTDTVVPQCVPQDALTAHIRATPNDYLFTVTFEGGQSPFTGINDFISNVQVALASKSEAISASSIGYHGYALEKDMSIIQLQLDETTIPYKTTMGLKFNDFTTDDSRPSYIKNQIITLELLTTTKDTVEKKNLIDIFSKVDYILEITWTAAAIFNPYWILYMDGKFFRESFDMYKRVNVQHEPFVNSFFKSNDRSISGVRVPNVFGIYLLGNDFSSEWTQNPPTQIGFKNVNPDRVEDLAVVVDNKVHQFGYWPLFLDNFGSELTVIGGLALIALVLEGLAKILRLHYKRPDPESSSYSVIKFLRRAIWTFLMLSVLGSFQSLSYYTAVQIAAFFSERTSNNKLSFYIGIPVFAVCALGVTIAISALSKMKVAKYEAMLSPSLSRDEPQPKRLGLFSSLMSFYKPYRLFYPLMLLIAVFRGAIFGAITYLLADWPIIQTAVLLGCNVFIFTLVLALRPFRRTTYTVFKVLYESVVCGMLGLLLALAILDNQNIFNSKVREVIGIAILILWILIPAMTILFAFVGVIQYVAQLMRPSEVPVSLKNLSHKAIHFQPVADKSNVGSPYIAEDPNKRLIMSKNAKKISPTDDIESARDIESKVFNVQDEEYAKEKDNYPTSNQYRSANTLATLTQLKEENQNLSGVPHRHPVISNLLSKRYKKPHEAIIDHSSSHEVSAHPEYTNNPSIELNFSNKPTNGRKRGTVQPVDLKLEPGSLKAIDEQGFREYNSPKNE